MARLPRLSLPDHLHYVSQRGPGDRPVFRDDDDRRTYLEALREAALTHAVRVHAYALLDGEAQWLATPADATSIGRMVQAIGQRFVTVSNRRHGSRGTRWEGRFRSAVVDATFGLQVMLLVEKSGPATDPWSSAAHHLGQHVTPWLSSLPAYWAMGNTPFEREGAYRREYEAAVDAALRDRLDVTARQGRVLGGGPFVEAIAAQHPQRPVKARPRGRPRLAGVAN
jgi:putative transposase